MNPYLQGLIDRAGTYEGGSDQGFVTHMGGNDAVQHLMIALLTQLVTNTTP